MGVTGSSFGRADVCLPSELLPKTLSTGGHWQTWGRVGHKFLCEVSTLGREDALDNAPAEYRDALSLIELERLPVDPSRFAPEVVFRYDVKSDTAVEVARGEPTRPYANDEDPWTMWGTADVVGLTEDAVVVADFKFGWGWIVPALVNPQLRSYALMACRAYGRSRAIIALCRIRDDGTPYYDQAELSVVDLDATAQAVYELHDRLEVARKLGREHWTPVEGPHCRYCKAFAHCPAKANLAVALGAGIALPAVIDPTNARAVYERLSSVRAVVLKVEEALDEYARAHPIDLGDGWVYAEKKQPRESIEPVLAEPVLAAMGLKGAIVTVPHITKEGLKEEVRKQIAAKYPQGPKPKGILGRTFGGAMHALREARAASTSYSSTVTRWRPKAGELPATAPPDSSGEGPQVEARTEAHPVEPDSGQLSQDLLEGATDA